MRWIVLVAGFALSGCVMTDGTQPSPMPDTCGAAALQGLVGQPQSVLQTMRFAQTVRVIQPGMMVTQDFSPDRLNIGVGPDGRIARVWCG